MEKHPKHSPRRPTFEVRDTFGRVSSFGKIQNLKQKQSKTKNAPAVNLPKGNMVTERKTSV